MLDFSFKNRTGNKPESLSAVIGADSFFYGLFDNEDTLLECKYYPHVIFNDEVFVDQIKSDLYGTEELPCKVSFTGKPYLHISNDENGEYLKYFPAFENKKVLNNNFLDQDVVIDFGIKKVQHKFIKNCLPTPLGKFHISTVLANYYYPYSINRVIAFLENSTLHIMYANTLKFIYYNQFTCKTEADYLYYIMLAYESLGLDAESVPLQFSGRVDEKSPIYKLLKDYVREIELMTSFKFSVSDLRFKAKQHFYLDLYATNICV